MEKQRLEKLESAVFGDKPDQTDGLVHIVSLHNRTLYGTELDPGGLERAVRNHTKTMWICTGVFIAAQFLREWWPVIKHAVDK